MNGLAILVGLRARLLLRSTGRRGGRPARVGRSMTRPFYVLAIIIFVAWTAYRLATDWVSSQGPIAHLLEAALLQPILTNLASAVSIVIFFYGFSSLIDTFTDKSDLRLLLLSPLSPALIMTEKLLEVSVRFSAILFLAVPALYALGTGLNVSSGYLPAVLIAILLLPLAPVGLAALVLLALLRVLPPARARSISSVLGAFLAISFFLGTRLARTGNIAMPQLPDWLPTVWPGRFLIETALGNTGTAIEFALLTLMLGGGIITLAVGASVHVFTTGWATYGEVGRRKRTAATLSYEAMPLGARKSEQVVPHDAPSTTAHQERPQSWRPLLRKDWLTMRRDTQWLMALIYPLLIVSFNFWQAASRGARLGGTGDTITLVALIVSSVLLVGTTVPPVINGEGRAIFLLALSPLTPRAIVRSKWLFGALPATIIVNVALFGLALYMGLPWGETLFEAVVLTLLTVTLAGVSLSLNLIWPKRDSGGSRRGATGMATIATLIAEAILGLGTGIVLGIDLHVWHGTDAFAGGIGLVLALLAVDLITAQTAPWLLNRMLWSERGFA